MTRFLYWFAVYRTKAARQTAVPDYRIVFGSLTKAAHWMKTQRRPTMYHLERITLKQDAQAFVLASLGLPTHWTCQLCNTANPPLQRNCTECGALTQT